MPSTALRTFRTAHRTFRQAGVFLTLASLLLPSAAQAQTHGLSQEEVVKQVFLKEQPTGKFATVAEIAATVAFLCSTAAASITGTSLAIDGGWTAH